MSPRLRAHIIGFGQGNVRTLLYIESGLTLMQLVANLACAK